MTGQDLLARQEGKPYVSLALDYHTIAGLPSEAITVVCKDMLIGYLNSMSSSGVREGD